MEDYAIRPGATTRGRTYQYFTGAVAYPFGYGLSYTSFRYDDLRVSRSAGTLTATARVTNTGSRPGAEVVQLYATTPGAPGRPRKRLIAFRKVALAAVDALAFYDERQARFRVDPGRYGLELAASSTDVRQRAGLTITGVPAPVPAVVTAKPVTHGTRIDPRVTVAMTDQTRYGPGHLPPGMTISYRSNRPSVVRPDGGTLIAGHAGVATITATAAYRDGTASATFVIVIR
jgi:beta-glucosidase